MLRAVDPLRPMQNRVAVYRFCSCAWRIHEVRNPVSHRFCGIEVAVLAQKGVDDAAQLLRDLRPQKQD